MFTDIYFTSHVLPQSGIALYQEVPSSGKVFKVIRCPYGWIHRLRIPWQLSFRMVRSPGNSSYPYLLKYTNRQEQKQFLISRDGILTVQQSCGEGKQVIDFEQSRGNTCCGIQIFRGTLLVAEAYFTGKNLRFQIDNSVGMVENFTEGMDIGPAVNANALKLDLFGMKAIYIALHPGKCKVTKQVYW